MIKSTLALIGLVVVVRYAYRHFTEQKPPRDPNT